MTDLYRVPKHEVAAEVTLAGGPQTPVTLYLAENAERHAGHERPSDVLNGPAAFFPVTEAGGKVVLLRRDAVLVLSVPAEQEFGERDARAEEVAAEQAVRLQVETTLEDGRRLRGLLAYLMPEGRTRLQDYLNLDDPFIVLREGNVARLVNKKHIASIAVVPEG